MSNAGVMLVEQRLERRQSSSVHDEDNESYWNASKTKARANLFEDADDESRATANDWLSKNKTLDMDDEENSSLAGLSLHPVEEPVAAATTILSSVTQSARYKSPSISSTQSQSSLSASVPRAEIQLEDPKLSAIRDSPEPKGHRRSPSSISDIVAATVREPTKSDIAKLEAQIKKLTWQLENQTVGSVSPEETIRRMLLGGAYVLQSYKTLEDKKYLLRLALDTHDGDVINRVLAFLKQTLCRSILQQVIQQSGDAASNQYITYLEENTLYAEAEDYEALVGRSEDSAMRRYRVAARATGSALITQLENCLRNQFSMNPEFQLEGSYVDQQIKLLRLQQIIEDADVRTEASGNHPIMKIHRRRQTLPQQSLVTTLFYCCLYHYDQPQNQFCSPHYIMTQFKISDAQFQWTAISALAKLKWWNRLEQLFAGKKWYGAATMNSAIGFHNVVKVLHRNKSTTDMLDKYCTLITNEDERLITAQKYSCNLTAVETLISMKDRLQLLQFRKKLKPGSAEAQKANYALENSSIKWKN